MKTLTEKYNAVLEGTFPKKQFVRDAKLSHPNFITQFTSYEDAVKILKNKGLVHETKKEEVQLNLPVSTLDKAIRYELEKAGVDYLMGAPGTDQYLKAKAKAEKALAKDRLYYLELNISKKKRTDVMEPATAKNVVDKGNEMKKVKTVRENTASSLEKKQTADLKEAIKTIIRNILA
jgi:transglutaminase/protease-like cytokinesis protein 3